MKLNSEPLPKEYCNESILETISKFSAEAGSLTCLNYPGKETVPFLDFPILPCPTNSMFSRDRFMMCILWPSGTERTGWGRPTDSTAWKSCLEWQVQGRQWWSDKDSCTNLRIILLLSLDHHQWRHSYSALKMSDKRLGSNSTIGEEGGGERLCLAHISICFRKQLTRWAGEVQPPT